MIELILLVIFFCIDVFVISFGYGVNKVKVFLYLNIIISVVCLVILVILFFVGIIVRDFLF